MGGEKAEVFGGVEKHSAAITGQKKMFTSLKYPGGAGCSGKSTLEAR
jgi:hypothetical protein